MKDEQRIKALEEEVKVLKSEIKMVLLDLREQYLNVQNPFNYGAVPSSGSGQMVNPVANNEIEQPQQPEEVKTEDRIDTPVNPAFPDTKMAGGLKRDEFPPLPSSPTPRTGSGNVRLWQGTELNDEEEEYDREPHRKELVSSQSRKRQEPDFYRGDMRVDLVVIAGLTQWIDQATAKLGKERTEILIEMFFAMGRLSEKLKDTMVRMIHISHHDSQGQSISASDYLALLAQLENLLADSKQQDKALLSILSMMKDSKDG